MAYVIPEIKDRVASGDDLYYIIDREDGKKQLVPAPNHITENGTPINRALLRQMAQGIKNNETLVNQTANSMSEEIEEKAGIFSLGTQKVTIGVI